MTTTRIPKVFADPHLYTSCVQMPYKTSYGTTVPMDHANAETLYMITQRMEANSGNRDAVLRLRREYWGRNWLPVYRMVKP